MGGPTVQVPDVFNIASEFLDKNVSEGRGDRAAVSSGEATYTYRQIQEMANRVGNALRTLGVEIENRILMIVLDSPEFVATFFGAMKIGAIPIPTNTLMKAPDYEYFLQDSRAKILVISAPLLSEFEKIDRKAVPSLKHVIVVGTPSGPHLSFDAWIAQASPHLEIERTGKDDMAFWLYSSGSTGLPKGVVHLHHDPLFCAETYYREVLTITERDRVFSVAKLFFAYGLGNCLYRTFQVGGSCILVPDRITPEKAFETIDRYQPTLLFAVPTLYAAMLAIPEAEKKYNCRSLRLCVSAGEALPPHLFEGWKKRFGVEILDGIGSTEACHIFLSNRPGRVRPGSSGELVPGYGVKIVDDEGRPVPTGEIGNLWITGDSTAPFYWNKYEKTKQTMKGEWLVTGDKYYQDADGYFWYAGRSDDMLKVSGIWVSPVEVENTLSGHPAVLECAVVGQEDADHLAKPKAYVVLKSGQKPSPTLEEELKAYVKDKIAPYKYPRWIEFVPELPKTATGKIQRFKLRQR